MDCLKSMNDEPMSVSTHNEYSWDTEMELLLVPLGDETKTVDVDNSQDSIELVAQKLLNENSDYWMYIRESELAELLPLALRHKKKDDHANSDQELDEETFILFNNILSAPFDDAFLIKSLRMLNSEKVLVVNWITLIIESHMEDVLFSKDKTLQKFLKQLKKVLPAKMEEYEDFVCIQNYFCVIGKESMLPKKCCKGKYSIESLDV